MKILAIGDFHGKFPDKIRKLILNEEPDLILSDGDYASIDEFRPALKKMFKARDRGNKIGLDEILGKKKYNLLLKKDYAAGKLPLIELNKFGISVLSVFGNGDWYNEDIENSKRDYGLLINKLKNVVNINRDAGKFRKVRIAGFGGYIDSDVYFEEGYIKKHESSIDSVRIRKERYSNDKKNFFKIMKNKPDILLVHYTPYGCLDIMKEKGYYLSGKHLGIGFFNEGIKKHKPALVVCGHMHENQGRCKIGKTLVVNPGPASEGKAAIIDFNEKEKKVISVRFI